MLHVFIFFGQNFAFRSKKLPLIFSLDFYPVAFYLLLFLSAAPIRGRHSGSAVSNFSCPPYPYRTLQPLACPLLPHPWTSSLVFLFSLAAPRTTFFYQYTLYSVSAHFHTTSSIKISITNKILFPKLQVKYLLKKSYCKSQRQKFVFYSFQQRFDIVLVFSLDVFKSVSASSFFSTPEFLTLRTFPMYSWRSTSRKAKMLGVGLQNCSL